MLTDVRSRSVVNCSVLACNCGGAPGRILRNDDPSGQRFPIWNASKIRDDSVVDVVCVVIDDDSIVYELDYAGDTLDRGADCYELHEYEVLQSDGVCIAVHN